LSVLVNLALTPILRTYFSAIDYCWEVSGLYLRQITWSRDWGFSWRL